MGYTVIWEGTYRAAETGDYKSLRDGSAGVLIGTGIYKVGKPVKIIPHKNSSSFVGETHVYRIKKPDGTTYKIGESAQGVRKGDGASVRAEQQVRKLIRKKGPGYESEIRKTFNSKREARAYEKKLIQRFKRRFGDDSLKEGNPIDR